MTRERKPFGTWASPISVKMMGGSVRLNEVGWDTNSDALVWLETHGKQGILMTQRGVDAPYALTDGDHSVRGRVGYGGGEFTVHAGSVYFAGPGGRIYRQALASGAPRPITPGFGSAAAPRVSADGEWLAYVHTYEHHDRLALVDTAGKTWPRHIVSGTDFVMQPAWHPSGTHIAYITWDHPQMPWDGTLLHLATLQTGPDDAPYISEDQIIAGDDETAIFQPEFSPDGRYLSYISDQTGFGQLYLYDIENGTHTQLTHEGEHITPAWVHGLRVYGWNPAGDALCILRNLGGFFSLLRVDLNGNAETVTGLDDYTALSQPAVSPHSGKIALIGSAARIPARVISLADDDSAPHVHARSSGERIPAEGLSDVHAITWQDDDGDDVHGLYYPPASTRYTDTGAPPLIVIVHGGPTTQKTAGYEAEAQFFTTRGYAVLYVNHRGSTGYGRDYMLRLRGNWGVWDVEDAASGALYLAEQGLADPTRFVIMGGSAGGFTVLQSLVEKPGFYRAGICRYGISNQFMLVQDTHKFEERYPDSLLGVLPEAADVFRARSPLFHAENIIDPVIIFQGDQDTVVPRNQSDSIVKSLAARGVPYEYHVYEGEGHGFRKPENIEAYHKSILNFLAQYVV